MFVAGNITSHRPIDATLKNQTMVNHVQKISGADKVPVTSTPIHAGDSDEFFSTIQSVKQNVTRIYQHEQEKYENRHALYLKSFRDGVYQGITSLAKSFETESENIQSRITSLRDLRAHVDFLEQTALKELHHVKRMTEEFREFAGKMQHFSLCEY